MSLKVKSAESCKFDLVSLGESMIRLSPAGMGGSNLPPRSKSGSAAASTTRPTPSRGSVCGPAGGGLNTSPMGRLIANHTRAAGIDVSHAVTRKYDGVDKVDRIGLNFTKVGHSKRVSVTLALGLFRFAIKLL